MCRGRGICRLMETRPNGAVILHANRFIFDSKLVVVVVVIGLMETRLNYHLLRRYDKILVACKMQGDRACEFSLNIAQSQYFVVLMQ